nr:MBL fold metallo-hydrolase [Candidatus Sigynarchaeota archaeon]
MGCSCTLVEEGKTRLLVDFGGDPARRTALALDESSLQEIRCLIITHAHFDHYGGIFDLFFTAKNKDRLPPIFCTQSTKQFLLQFGYKEWLQFGRETRALDVQGQNQFFNTLQQKIVAVSYGHTCRLEDLEFLLLPASHILGSAQVYVRSPFAEGLFTSDFKPSGTTLLRGVSALQLTSTFNVNLKPDFVVVESTYGKNAADIDKALVEKQLVDSIREVFEHGGNLLVPCFAIGRAQEFMSYYYRLMGQHTGITPLNVYLVGATSKMTQIYLDAALAKQEVNTTFNDNVKSLLQWANLPSIRDLDGHLKATGVHGDLRQKVSHVKENGFNLFITSGGMLHGPALELFMELKDDPNNALFLVGYQAPGTSGHALAEAVRSRDNRKRLRFDGNHLLIEPSELQVSSHSYSDAIRYKPLQFQFKVLQFSIFSAHATFSEKMQYLSNLAKNSIDNKIRVFTTHGIEENCVEFSKEVEYAGFVGTAPRINDNYPI